MYGFLLTPAQGAGYLFLGRLGEWLNETHGRALGHGEKVQSLLAEVQKLLNG
jgi:hypothetical protein